MLPFLQKRKSHFGALSNFSVLSLLQMAQQAFIAPSLDISLSWRMWNAE